MKQIKLWNDYYFTHESGGQWHIVPPKRQGETVCGIKYKYDQISLENFCVNLCEKCLNKLDPSLYEIVEWKLPLEEVGRQITIHSRIPNLPDHPFRGSNL